ncbi:MAG TPA: dihydropteroate synthase, partial [Acidobacteriaceae bacterium]
MRQAAGHPGGDTNSPDLLARLLRLGRPLVMGVLNVTPDSFSDGGHFFDPAAALKRARRMVADGADILDIGAESTRPYGGAVAVPSAEEIGRLARVLPGAVGLGVPVSIDTMKTSVAEWALAAGAVVVNDIWGLQRDSELARVVA